MLLQKRASNKDVAPDKWDTSVGGQLMPGEEYFNMLLKEKMISRRN